MGRFGTGAFGIDPFKAGAFGKGPFGVSGNNGIGGIDSFTKLILHLDNNVTDSSLSPKTVTNNGVTFSNTIYKFNGYSGLFPGTLNTALTVPDSADWAFASGDFTVDTWIRPTVGGVSATIAGQGNTIATVLSWYYTRNVDNTISFVVSGANPGNVTSVSTLALDAWTHLAFVRNGNLGTQYFNGVADATTLDMTSVIVPDIANNLGIGQIGEDTSDNLFTGYMDEFRISKGIARWTSNFTPPAGPYTT